jgi:phosphopantothenoylcysteine synthetase/decarboxylase
MKHRPRYLVTAGSTREMIDRVRDWGNIFTGNTGYEIAMALTEAGGDVDLLTSNHSHLAEILLGAGQRPGSLRATGFTSRAQLKRELASLTAQQTYDAVFMTAAVADYAPIRTYEVVRRSSGKTGEESWVVRDVQAAKVKSTHREVAVLGKRTEKLIDLFRTKWRHEGLLVKFKLEVGVEDEELLRIGNASRRASGADYLVANTLEMTTGPRAGAYLLGEGSPEWVPRATLAPRLRSLVTAETTGPRRESLRAEGQRSMARQL